MSPIEKIRLDSAYGRVLATLTGVGVETHLYEIRYLNGVYTFRWDDSRDDVPVDWREHVYRSRTPIFPDIHFLGTIPTPRDATERVKANPRLRLRYS